MLRLWKWYRNCLEMHPVKTQMISSGVIWGTGDIAAQSITINATPKGPRSQDEEKEEKEANINWKRVSTTSLFGFGFVGPFGHIWYQGLDRFIRSRLALQPNSLRFVASKVAIDGFLFPVDLLIFYSYMGLSAGKSVSQIKEDVKRDFVTAIILEGGIWPPVQFANFRFVPVRYQLLYANLFCLLDSCFLSWLEQQQDDSLKEWLTSLLSAKEKRDQGG